LSGISAYSLEELKRIVRRIEFNKTSPELLLDLISKARSLGSEERRSIKRILYHSKNLSKILLENELIIPISIKQEAIKKLSGIPTWAVDGSNQVIKGLRDEWFVFLSASRVFMPKGMQGKVEFRVGGDIQKIKALDDAMARSKATNLMMLMEIEQIGEAYRDARKLGINDALLIIDGPIIDPPQLSREEYVRQRVKVIKKCLSIGFTFLGFVKRPYGRPFLSFLEKMSFEGISHSKSYISDVTILNPILFLAICKENKSSRVIITRPQEMPILKEPPFSTYQVYKKLGLNIYYCYYKFDLRSGVYRLELASTEEFNDNKLLRIFNGVIPVIYALTPPGMKFPLPILIAHDKCSIRKGAAETLYYEIITRTLVQEMSMPWISEEVKDVTY